MKNSRTYLSIDLDYWNDIFREHNNPEEHLRSFLQKVISHVHARNVPLCIVDSHESLLRHANLCGRNGCDRLTNLDHHSDIYDRFWEKLPRNQKNLFNCGTWINYVNFRKTGTFTWMAPYEYEDASDRSGFCHGVEIDDVNNPFEHPEVGGWKETHFIHTLNPHDAIKWDWVCGVGVAFSYYWLNNCYDKEIIKIASKILGYKPKLNKRAKIE